MNNADKKRFKAQAHALKPVIMIGNAGLTPAVLAEIERALDIHELIKIRIRAERDDRERMSVQICLDTKAELIQKIGQISVIYRKNPNLK
ncbi:MAG: YhbY family RNA-binding protein [Methylococcaceae bacterium]|nr:YhbY family RNA-binding protein [Methylococcaceae bacterium]